MQCTIINATQFDLLLEENYLDSGKYWTAPGAAVPFDQMTFTGCNKDHSPFTGVSGGLLYKVYLDEEHSFRFAIVSRIVRFVAFRANNELGTDRPRGRRLQGWCRGVICCQGRV